MSSPHCAVTPQLDLPSRRAVVAGFACLAVAPGATPALAQSKTTASAADERYMRTALDEARNADFPFGAGNSRFKKHLLEIFN